MAEFNDFAELNVKVTTQGAKEATDQLNALGDASEHAQKKAEIHAREEKKREEGLRQSAEATSKFEKAMGVATDAVDGNILALSRQLGQVGLVIGALALLAKAWKNGSEEADRLANALTVTGSRSGTTAAQLNAMAASMDNVAGITQKAATGALVTFIEKTHAGGASLERFATAALLWEKAGVQAVEKTAAAFASLEQAPLRAAMKLNEQMNFLSATQVKLIYELEKTGQHTEAVRVAQEAYAKAIEERAPEMERRLGLIEKAWRGIKGAAKEAWDEMLAIGRESDKIGDLQPVINNLREKIKRQRIGTGDPNDATTWNGTPSAKSEAALKALLEQQSILQSDARLNQLNATLMAQQEEKARATAVWLEFQANHMDRIAKRNREMVEAYQKGKAAGASDEEIAAEFKYIENKYRDKKGIAEAERDAIQFANAQGKIIEKVDDLIQKNQLYLSGNKDLTASQRVLLEVGEYLRDNYKELSAAEVASLQAKINLAAATSEEADFREKLNKAAEASVKSTAKALDAFDDENKKIEEKIKKLKQEREELGKSRSEVEALTAARKREEMAIWQKRIALEEARDRGEGPEVEAMRERVRLLGIELDEQERLAKAAKESESAKVVAAEWKRVSEQIENSLTDALVNGFNKGKGFFQSIGDWIVNYFKATVARGIAQAIMGGIGLGTATAANASPLGSMLSGFLGSPGGNDGAGSGILGSLIGPISGGMGLGALGTGFMGGLSGLGTSLGFSGTMANAGWLMANGNMLGGLGMGLGAAAPYLAAAYGLYRIISGVGTGRQRGEAFQEFSALTGAGSTIGGFWGGNVKNPAGGSWQGGHYDTQLKAVIDAVNMTAKSFGGSGNTGTQYGQFASWSPDGLGALVAGDVRSASGRQLFSYSQNGSNADMGQRLAALAPNLILAGLKDSNLPKQIKDYFESFDMGQGKLFTQEEVDAAIQLAAAAQQMAMAFRDLGGPFLALNDMSVEARKSLADLTGGFDAFIQKVQGYYSEFYSPEEQSAMSLMSANKTLEAAGIDTGQFKGSTEEEVKRSFRSYLETLDPSKEPEKFAAMINAAGSFASGAELLANTGMSLDELTANAPDYTIQLDTVAAAAENTNAILSTTNGILSQILEAIRNQVVNVNVSAPAGQGVEVYSGGFSDA